MKMVTKAAAAVVAAAAITGACAGTASATTVTDTTHAGVQSGSPMVARDITFTNNTGNDIWTGNVSDQNANGCVWHLAPVAGAIIKPGDSFVAGVQMELFQNTQCDFLIGTAVNGYPNLDGTLNITLKVDGVNKLYPKIIAGGDLGAEGLYTDDTLTTLLIEHR